MIAILGGLGAAVAWAASVVCSSRSSRLIAPSLVLAWVMLVGLVISGPLALPQGVPSALGREPGMWLLIGGACNVGGLLVVYSALRAGHVAVIAPLVSTDGAIAAVIAITAGETLAPGAGVTLAAIAVGVCLASVPPEDRSDTVDANHVRTTLLALVAACTFGLGLYATARAGSSLPAAWVVLAARLIGVIVIALPLALAGRLRLTRRAAPLVVTSGVCEVVGYYSYIAGARHGIAVAAVLSSQFATLAAIVGYYLFGERLTRIQVAGIATVLGGVAVISGLQA
jgi:drug/metabolite transporter (DMT)-like permease